MCLRANCTRLIIPYLGILLWLCLRTVYAADLHFVTPKADLEGHIAHYAKDVNIVHVCFLCVTDFMLERGSTAYLYRHFCHIHSSVHIVCVNANLQTGYFVMRTYHKRHPQTENARQLNLGRRISHHASILVSRLVPRENWWYGTCTTKTCGTKQYFPLVLIS
jgi:hypothetical protein